MLLAQQRHSLAAENGSHQQRMMVVEKFSLVGQVLVEADVQVNAAAGRQRHSLDRLIGVGHFVVRYEAFVLVVDKIKFRILLHHFDTGASGQMDLPVTCHVEDDAEALGVPVDEVDAVERLAKARVGVEQAGEVVALQLVEGAPGRLEQGAAHVEPHSVTTRCCCSSSCHHHHPQSPEL